MLTLYTMTMNNITFNLLSDKTKDDNVCGPDKIKILDLRFYPTLPSRLMANNFCASTANSIGN